MNPIAASVAAAREEQERHRTPPARLVSLDAFRGLAIFLLAAEWLHIPKVAQHFPSNVFWQAAGRHTQHVDWSGCALHDLIQPAFSFMVGVAVPFSVAGRVARGQSPVRLWLHALWRALLLILLGVFLRSIGRPMTYWTFEDTLSQIGLGYPALFALAFFSRGVSWTVLAVLLGGYWALFAAAPLPGADFDWARFNARAWFEGFAAHWNQNTNPAWAFDRWFLNLFPREQEFLGNPGGYVTLSFVTTLGTMILGLISGSWLNDWRRRRDAEPREETPRAGLHPAVRLVLAGAICLALGLFLDRLGVSPSVKRIWTPSWVLVSGGWCFLGMAFFHLVADVAGAGALFFPLVVFGMNSLAAYVLVHQPAEFIGEALYTHFGRTTFQVAGEAFEPLLHGGDVVAIVWLILFWMHRRKIHLRL